MIGVIRLIYLRKIMFNGVNTALITPFSGNELDEAALKKLIESQIEGGVDGLVICGTTGESPTLSHDEHLKAIELSVKFANGKVKIIAGTGSNSTKEAIHMTNFAKKVGADGCLIVAPYYNKPTADGIYQHFAKLNECGIPLIVYNIPGRSVINISDDLIAKMADELENVVAVKDATGDLTRIANLRSKIKKDFCYLSGEDQTIVGFNAMGGNGIISVTSNIAPKLCKLLQNYCDQGDYEEARKLQDKLLELNQSMFCETNPIPVKYAAHLLDLCESEIRLPLCHPSDNSKEKILTALKNVGLV